uniref:Uncharacterized protein n=1 Tax=uncultured myxobacterium HF0200_08J13 TaxID=723558 RepID=E7C3Q3_9BACT|nr:hypothetical protein [uncultured myxobacterium HF0200_08J13]
MSTDNPMPPTSPQSEPGGTPAKDDPEEKTRIPDARFGKVTRWVCSVTVLFVVIAAVPCWNRMRDSAVAQCLLDCRAAQQDGDWQVLQEAADRWLWWQSRHGQALVFRALASEQTGQLEEAVRFLERIPDDDEFMLAGRTAQIDILLLQLNRPSQAEVACQRILNIDPAATPAQLRLIHIYSTTLQHEKLREVIRGAIASRAEPKEAWPVLFQLDQLLPSSGYATVTRWKIEEPELESLIVAQAIYANEQRRANRQEPREHLAQAVARFPENRDLLAYRIEVALIDYEVELAASLLETAPESALQDPRFWRFKASVHEDRDEIELAVSAVNKSLELYPLGWRSQKILAGLLRRRGDQDNATRLSRQSTEGKHIEDALNSLLESKDWLTVPDLPGQMVKFARLSGDRDAEYLGERTMN